MVNLQDKLNALENDINEIRNILIEIDSKVVSEHLINNGILQEGETIADLPTNKIVDAILSLDQIKDFNCKFNHAETHFKWKLVDLIKRNAFKYAKNYAFMFSSNPFVTSFPIEITEEQEEYEFPIESFDNVDSVAEMFRNCTELKYLEKGFSLPQATKMNGMFQGCKNMQMRYVSAENDFNKIELSYVEETPDEKGETNSSKYGCTSMFNSCESITYTPVIGGCANNTNYSNMFADCKELTTIAESFQPSLNKNLPQNVPIAANFFNMFVRNFKLSTIPENWDLSIGTNYSYMFGDNQDLKKVSLILNTSSSVNMEGMFFQSFLLEDIGDSLVDTKPINTRTMFKYCHQLTSLKLGDMSKCNDCTDMFYTSSEKKYGWIKITDLSISNSENGVPEWKCGIGKEEAIDFSNCYFESDSFSVCMKSIGAACLNYAKNRFPTTVGDIKVYIKLPHEMLDQQDKTLYDFKDNEVKYSFIGYYEN